MIYDVTTYGDQSVYSNIYDEGSMDNEDGVLRQGCPYSLGTPERKAWLGGWDSFQPTREAWESEMHEAAKWA